MQTLLQDLRYGARMLAKQPGFTFVAVITLALGIGANTAIFSVVNTVLLRPLPYAEPGRLVQIWETYHPQFPTLGVSGGNFQEWKADTQSFTAMAAYRYVAQGMNLTGEGEPEQLQATYASANLFPLLGVQATVGRTFLPAEDEPGGAPVALLSYRLWQRRFNGDRQVIGKTLALEGKGYAVVGVLPDGFNLPQWADLWLPTGAMSAELTSRVYHPFSVIARLKKGVSLGQAEAEMISRAGQLEQAYPKTSKNFGVTVLPLQAEFTGKLRPVLLVLLGAVGLVLLIACANVANLLLARGAARQKEMALRTALGASRWRIVRQLLTESLLLATAGGVAGLLAAVWGLDLLKALIPAELPRARESGLDGWMLGFTMGLSILTGLICGLLPAWQAARLNLNEALKEGNRNVAAGFGRHRLRGLLVVAEVATAMVLLVGAGLLIKSFVRLLEVEPGYDPARLLTMRVSLPGDALDGGGERGARLFQQIAERIKALPGVEAVGGVRYLPLTTEAAQRWRFLVEGQPSVEVSALPVAETRDISLDYFHTMGIPLRAGRSFTEHDWGQPQIIINETLARRYWPEAEAIGRRVNINPLGAQPSWATVVGVVGDVHQLKLDGAPTFDIYWTGTWTRQLVVRTTVEPLGLVAAVRHEIHAVDPSLPISEVAPMEQLLAESVAARRFAMLLFNLFAALALALAVVGIYGVMTYTVTQRTREIGLRMALGAEASAMLRLVIGQGMKLVLAGALMGLGGALGLTRLMAALLFGTSATDPITFVAITLLLIVTAVLACYLPARRATKIDPMTALRHE